VNVEEFHLNELLRALEITREQLVDMSILIGTDFNPDGVKGVGPKTAYKFIKEHGDLETIIEKEDKVSLDLDIDEVRDIFLNPVTIDDYDISFKTIDVDGVVQFLCEERGFSKERVRSTLEKAKKGQDATLRQKSLDSFFS
jgi:flap endonuclease-1